MTLTRDLALLKICIYSYDPSKEKKILEFLDPSTKKAYAGQKVHLAPLRFLLSESASIMQNIHPSWLKPFLNKFAPSHRDTIISALTETSKSHIFSPVIKSFFYDYFYQFLKSDETIPVEYIDSSLVSLAKLDKVQLINLINCLAIYDLVPEIRKIVQKTQLQAINAVLSAFQKEYLKTLLRYKEVLTSSKLDVSLLRDSPLKFSQMLHKRGLARLGKALIQEPSSLIWHIIHHLDQKRGMILLNYWKTVKEDEKVLVYLKSQVLQTLHFLKF